MRGVPYRHLVGADDAGLGVHRFERRRAASGRRRRGSVTSRGRGEGEEEAIDPFFRFSTVLDYIRSFFLFTIVPFLLA
jgi:hypothetical protein